MVKSYVRVSKVEALKFAQKEFNVPIVVVEAVQNSATGQEIVLVKTKSFPPNWHIVWLGQDADANYFSDEAQARKDFIEYGK